MKDFLAGLFGLPKPSAYKELEERNRRLQAELETIKSSLATVRLISEEGVQFYVNGAPKQGTVYIEKGTEVTVYCTKGNRPVESLIVEEEP